MIATFQIVPHLFCSIMILKTGANAQISIHADSCHHTIVIKEPSFDFFIISSCRDWWIISEMGVKTNRSQQHPEREGPISVIGAIELHIHDRGTKRDWRKYAGRRGEDPMAAAGGETRGVGEPPAQEEVDPSPQ